MKNWILIGIGLSILVAFVIYAVARLSVETEKTGAYKSVEIGLYEMFYETANFTQATTKVKDVEAQKDVRAIIVPHHLLASEYIAGMIKRSVGRPIDNVIIIGPNHWNAGEGVLSSAHAVWETPFGQVQTDEKLVLDFLQSFKLQVNTEVFAKEHSVGAIVPFVKYYIPDAKIVPIVISSYATHRDAEELVEWITQELDDKTLIIVSTDFSHYLSKEVAKKNDIYTKSLIDNQDTKRIALLNNDFDDSPVSLSAIVLLARELGWGTEYLYHGNSFNFMTQKPIETTSYFGIAFTEP